MKKKTSKFAEAWKKYKQEREERKSNRMDGIISEWTESVAKATGIPKEYIADYPWKEVKEMTKEGAVRSLLSDLNRYTRDPGPYSSKWLVLRPDYQDSNILFYDNILNLDPWRTAFSEWIRNNDVEIRIRECDLEKCLNICPSFFDGMKLSMITDVDPMRRLGRTTMYSNAVGFAVACPVCGTISPVEETKCPGCGMHFN